MHVTCTPITGTVMVLRLQHLRMHPQLLCQKKLLLVCVLMILHHTKWRQKVWKCILQHLLTIFVYTTINASHEVLILSHVLC